MYDAVAAGHENVAQERRVMRERDVDKEEFFKFLQEEIASEEHRLFGPIGISKKFLQERQWTQEKIRGILMDPAILRYMEHSFPRLASATRDSQFDTYRLYALLESSDDVLSISEGTEYWGEWLFKSQSHDTKVISLQSVIASPSQIPDALVIDHVRTRSRSKYLFVRPRGIQVNFSCTGFRTSALYPTMEYSQSTANYLRRQPLEWAFVNPLSPSNRVELSFDIDGAPHAYLNPIGEKAKGSSRFMCRYNFGRDEIVRCEPLREYLDELVERCEDPYTIHPRYGATPASNILADLEPMLKACANNQPRHKVQR